MKVGRLRTMLYDSYHFLQEIDTTKSWLIIGPSGVGKTSLAHNIARSIIDNNRGLAVLDPHGGLINDLTSCIPRSRLKETIWFEPESVSWNLCPYAPHEPLKIEHTIDALTALFPMENESIRLLGHCLNVHRFVRNSHIGDVLKMLQDQEYRERIVHQCEDQLTRDFWNFEYVEWFATPRLLADYSNPVKTIIEGLLRHPAVRTMLCQPKSTVDMGEVMERGQILFAPFYRGVYGDNVASTLGALLLAQFRSAAFAKPRPVTPFIIDEFPFFAGEKIITSTLATGRAFGLFLGLICQYGGQSAKVVEAALENAETVLAYHPVGEMFTDFDWGEMPYRSVAVKTSTNKFVGFPQPKQFPQLFKRLTRYTRPEQIKVHSRQRYGNKKKKGHTNDV